MIDIRDTQPDNPIACCIICAVWVCDNQTACAGFSRARGNLLGKQDCGWCGGIVGHFEAIRHQKPRHYSDEAKYAYNQPRPAPSYLMIDPHIESEG